MTAKRLQSGGAHGEAPVQKRPRWCCAEEAGPTPGAGADARKAVRDLQWACRQRPLDWWTAAAAAGVLGAGAAALTAKDAAVALQALAKVDDCDEARTAEALVRERLLQPASCDELDACGVAIALWALARRGLEGRGSALARALQRRFAAVASQCNSQDVANVLWSFAKLRWSPASRCWSALVLRTAAVAALMKPQELSIALWAVASLGEPLDASAGEALQGAALQGVTYFMAQSVANALWALATLAGRGLLEPRAELVRALAEQATANARFFTSQGLANALWACAQLGVPAARVAALAEALRAGELGGTDVGEIAWALARLSFPGYAWAQLQERAVDLAESGGLDWQALGRVDYARRALGGAGGGASPRLRQALCDRAAHAVAEVNGARHQTSLGAEAALLEAGSEGPAGALPPGARVLLVDDCGATLAAALRLRGARVTRWRRFCRGPRAGAAWPPGRSGGRLYDGSVMRLPSTKAALELAVQAVAPLLQPGAGLWLYGAVSEGGLAMRSALAGPAFYNARTVALRGEFVVAAAIRGDSPLRERSLAEFAEQAEIELGGAPLPWRVYPGLFAGGGLDVMTSALLRVLPQPPARARILDFCCGSGSIAAALLQRAAAAGDAGARLHLLDADAVALEAARANVPSARRFHLSDAWSAVPAEARYDWIVSNPPVHCGLRHDFTVLSRLLDACPGRLRPKGSLWLVAQTYVPVGCLCPSARSIWSDGRFTVWRVDAGAGAPAGE